MKDPCSSLFASQHHGGGGVVAKIQQLPSCLRFSKDSERLLAGLSECFMLCLPIRILATGQQAQSHLMILFGSTLHCAHTDTRDQDPTRYPIRLCQS